MLYMSPNVLFHIMNIDSRWLFLGGGGEGGGIQSFSRRPVYSNIDQSAVRAEC